MVSTWSLRGSLLHVTAVLACVMIAVSCGSGDQKAQLAEANVSPSLAVTAPTPSSLPAATSTTFPRSASVVEPARPSPTAVELPMPASPVVASVVATPSTTAPSTGVMKTPTRQGEEVPPSAQANVPVEPPPTVIATRIEAASGVVRIANGGEVYGATCARCHGDNGVGSQQGSALLGASNRWSGPTLLNELTNGHAFTFGFADKLSADELTNVVAYVLASF